jgi:hypothetical protein
MHEQDPLDVLNLTESILVSLAAVSAVQSKDALGNATEKSPLQGVIPESYQNLQNADLNCDYIHDQSWWCEVLVNGEMFPWLWDINIDMIN